MNFFLKGDFLDMWLMHSVMQLSAEGNPNEQICCQTLSSCNIFADILGTLSLCTVTLTLQRCIFACQWWNKAAVQIICASVDADDWSKWDRAVTPFRSRLWFLTHCNLKSHSSVFHFHIFSALPLAVFIPGWSTNADGKCVSITWFNFCFRNHSGPVVPALRSLPQCGKHTPLSVPCGLHWQLLRGAAGWVWLQPMSEWCYLQGSSGWIPVRGNAECFSRKWPEYLGHCNAKASKEAWNTCKW